MTPAFAGLAVAVVIALLGVAALASREPLNGFGSVGMLPAARTVPHATFTPWALTLMGAAATLALIGLQAYVQGYRPRRRELGKTPSLLRMAILLVLFLLVAVLVSTALDRTHRRPLRRSGGSLVFGARTRRGAASSSFALPPWVTFAVLALVIAGGAVLAIWAMRRRRERRGGETLELAPAIRGAVELSIEDLRVDPDSRRAVIAAYARMEATLAAAGLPRTAVEAPREYLTRVLGSLEVSGRPITRLTSLFELARFSLHRIGPTLRDEAISALDEIRAELELA